MKKISLQDKSIKRQILLCCAAKLLFPTLTDSQMNHHWKKWTQEEVQSMVPTLDPLSFKSYLLYLFPKLMLIDILFHVIPFSCGRCFTSSNLSSFKVDMLNFTNLSWNMDTPPLSNLPSSKRPSVLPQKQRGAESVFIISKGFTVTLEFGVIFQQCFRHVVYKALRDSLNSKISG